MRAVWVFGFKANVVAHKYPIEIKVNSSKTATTITTITITRTMRPRHVDGDVATKPQNQFDDGVEVEGLLHFQATLSPLVELTEV